MLIISSVARSKSDNLNLDKERVARNPEQMAAEATELRALFEETNDS